MTEIVAPPLVHPVVLEGAHVRLEPLSLDHVPALVAAASEDRATYGWTTVPDGEREMHAYVASALELAERGQAVPFATIAVASGRVIGTTRFANFEYFAWTDGSPHAKPAGHPDGVEIGWTWLAASAQRTAANSEAKLLMLDHAFNTWGVRVVRWKTDRRNERSRAAIERLGARFDGILRAHSPGADGAVRDSAYFSMLAEEWPPAREGLLSRLAR
jgi:RimJ/RimL family protein N-acetyltransferase